MRNLFLISLFFLFGIGIVQESSSQPLKQIKLSCFQCDINPYTTWLAAYDDLHTNAGKSDVVIPANDLVADELSSLFFKNKYVCEFKGQYMAAKYNSVLIYDLKHCREDN